jgi:predicted nucleotide-binding protein
VVLRWSVTVTKKPETKPAPANKVTDDTKRTRISQADVPAFSLGEALRVARAISSQYGGKPTKPINVAQAMELSPGSSGFKMLTGASIAYGLTEGGYNAAEISLTPLGKQIVAPLEEGADQRGMVSAYLKPKIIADFTRKYDGSQLPREDIALNVLAEMGVPKERAKSVFELIIKEADALHLVSDIKGKKYLNLSNSAHQSWNSSDVEKPDAQELNPSVYEAVGPMPSTSTLILDQQAVKISNDGRAKRVFITHGKNTALIAPIKKLLSFGELEPIVSAEKQTVSQPVPEKVMRDMRGCGAAIIHVDGEQKLLDSAAEEHIVLNPNVLIEIGAAMALYGRRFILLVKDGVKLPSNLQGLYEVRYQGESLDGDATIRLLEAINQLKAESLEPAAGN